MRTSTQANGSGETGALRSEGFVGNLSQAALKALDSIKFEAGYPEGSTLFTEGETARGVMLLYQGRAKISMTSIEGKVLILRVARPGEVLGLDAVISDRPCQAAVETLEPCQVVFLRREDFLSFLRAHGEASLAAAKQLAQTYETACEQVRSIGLSAAVPEKLARFLLDWTVEGRQTAEGVRSVINLTHEEIGQMIGSSRETVTRTLSDFRARRLATIKGAMVTVPNRSALATFERLEQAARRGRSHGRNPELASGRLERSASVMANSLADLPSSTRPVMVAALPFFSCGDRLPACAKKA